MSYDVTLVQVADRPHGGAAIFTPFPNPLCGFPASFDFMLASMWVCLPGSGGGGSSAAFNFPFFTLQAISDNNTILVKLYDGTGAQIYSATYAAPLVGVRSNVILSVDSIAQIVQVYLNDAPLSVTIGGVWTAAGPFAVGGGSKASGWLFSYTGVLFDPASADMWAAAPDSFVDLAVTANRRKFITSNWTPVDLGATGAGPLGVSPPVFLTVPSGGVATDIQNNYGTGGAFSSLIGTPTITFQTPGVCTLPTPPPGLPETFCGVIHTASSFTASWTPTGGTATSYTVDYRKVGDVSFTEVAGITDTFLVITGLVSSTAYEFKVKAINDSGESDFSELQSCSTDAMVQFLSCDADWTIVQPVSKIYGLDHLAGLVVTGLADGIALEPFVVGLDGTADIPFPASIITLGLGYPVQVQTPYLDTGAPTVQGRRKDIVAVTVRVDSSAVPDVGSNQLDGGAQVPVSVGPPWTDMFPAVTANPNLLPESYVGPSGQTTTKLFSGDFRANVKAGWDERGQTAVQQTLPLPLSLTAVVPELLEGDVSEQGYSKKEQSQEQRGPGPWMLRR